MTLSIRKVVVLALAFMMLAAAPAMACGPRHFSGTMESLTVGFNPDPAAVSERCPEGFEWILDTAGTVEIKSRVFEGSMTLASQHCSRWLTPPGENAWGQIGAGLMILTSGEDELHLAYEGYFRFKGDVTTEWVSKVVATYRIVGGEGVFEAARGKGLLLLKDETNVQTGRLRGLIRSGR